MGRSAPYNECSQAKPWTARDRPGRCSRIFTPGLQKMQHAAPMAGSCKTSGFPLARGKFLFAGLQNLLKLAWTSSVTLHVFLTLLCHPDFLTEVFLTLQCHLMH